MPNRIVYATLVGAALLASIGAQAGGDKTSGATNATLCAACHGIKGISSNPMWPNLAGQQAGYLIKQIKAFRDGARVEPTMAPFVQVLTDQDIDDLAAHYSQLKVCP